MKKNISLKPVALITGAAKRIGKSFAMALAQKGYDIALHYHRSQEEAERTRHELQTLGSRVFLLKGSLEKSETVRKLIPQTLKFFGRLDVLINSASTFEQTPFLKTTERILDRDLAIHFKAPFFLTQIFAQTVKMGQVIQMLDSDISKNKSSYFSYLLSKKILAEFTKMAALELAPSIRVNAIAPGFILPPSNFDPKISKRLIEKIPLKKQGSAEHLNQALNYLLENDYVNGETLFVDGGNFLL